MKSTKISMTKVLVIFCTLKKDLNTLSLTATDEALDRPIFILTGPFQPLLSKWLYQHSSDPSGT